MDNIEKIKEILSKEPSVVLAYLFGSRIKGTTNHRSDWDIAIYFTQNTLDSDQWHDFNISAKLSQILKSEAQVITLNKPPNPLLGFEIIGKGKLLLCRDNNLRLDYENRILRNYHDWSYFYKRSIKK